MDNLQNNSEPGLSEFFFDFDRNELKRFVRRLSKLIEQGFGKGEVSQVIKAADALQRGREVRLRFSIRHDGMATKLVVRLLATDDIEFPTLYVYSSPALIESIEEELSKFVEQGPDQD